MKFLLDQNISPKTTIFLRALGHDAVDTRDLGLTEADDATLWDIALGQGRILISFDLDSADARAYPRRYDPGIIVFRTRSTTSKTLNTLLTNLFESYTQEEIEGKLIIVTESQIRIRS